MSTIAMRHPTPIIDTAMTTHTRPMCNVHRWLPHEKRAMNSGERANTICTCAFSRGWREPSQILNKHHDILQRVFNTDVAILGQGNP